MSEEEKYKQFWEKFSKSMSELQNDFNNMSDNNKIRIISDMQNVLIGYGITVSIDALRRMLGQNNCK